MKIHINLKNITKEINPAFHFLLSNKNRNVVCRGGAGSGKSYAIIQSLLYFILRDFKKPYSHKFLLLRKTSPAARKSLFPLIEHIIKKWKIQPLVKLNKTEGTFTFINGSQLMITSLDDPEKIKSIFGIDKIFMEEANEFTLDDYRQLSLRMRGDKSKIYQIYMAFNPVSKFSWLYKEFYEKKQRNTFLHLSTYKDNLHLDDEYKLQLEDLVNQDQNYALIYLYGEFGNSVNVIYSNWRVVDNFPESVGEMIYGLDFGFSHPTTLIKCGITKEGIYLQEELYKSGLTNKDLINILNKKKINHNSKIYADSALPGNITEIRREGFNIIGAKKQPHSVKEGIDFVKRQKLFVTRDSPNLMKELNSYAYKTDKSTGELTEEPIKHNDDACDAIRYALYSHLHNKVNYSVIIPD